MCQIFKKVVIIPSTNKSGKITNNIFHEIPIYPFDIVLLLFLKLFFHLLKNEAYSLRVNLSLQFDKNLDFLETEYRIFLTNTLVRFLRRICNFTNQILF